MYKVFLGFCYLDKKAKFVLKVLRADQQGYSHNPENTIEEKYLQCGIKYLDKVKEMGKLDRIKKL